MKEMEKLTPLRTHPPRAQWMLAMYLSLIYARADHHCQAYHNYNMVWNLIKAVRNSLMLDTFCRSVAAIEEIGACLETPNGTPSYLQGSY